MPFYYDMSDIEWPDDDSDPPPPTPADFQYLTPPQAGGAREPIRFVDPSGEATPASSDGQKTGFLGKLFGPLFSRSRAPMMPDNDRSQAFMAIMIRQLRQANVRSLYIRYDGGNDEGFSWLESATLRDGTVVSVTELAELLNAPQLFADLTQVGFVHTSDERPQREQLQDLLHYSLTEEWSVFVLGRGFGTGEFYLYGAFTADLDTCTLIDDRNAEPIVENIELETGD